MRDRRRLLIDVEHAIIVDVEATTTIGHAEVLTAKRMIERSMDRFGLYPTRLMGDSAYGSSSSQQPPRTSGSWPN